MPSLIAVHVGFPLQDDPHVQGRVAGLNDALVHVEAQRLAVVDEPLQLGVVQEREMIGNPKIGRRQRFALGRHGQGG